MRDSSYNFHTQTQQIFSRGGEKKVMKKSLSILLSFALVFGLFASLASAADNELTVAQKYQALVDKGVLKGNPDGDARLDNNLNRAEYATIAIAIAGLAEEKPATATFSDVTSKQWWYGAIEAAAKAGLVDGVGGGKFDPRSNVTIEQVIKVAVQAAGVEIDEDAAEVEGASAWAAPYIQAALNAGLIAEGLDYKADATRGQTILVGYSVYEALNPTVPAKVSVSSAKASNYNEVEVVLNKAVDTEKAKVSLKKGAAAVATETKWSEDGKTATLTLTGSGRIGDGSYTATLSGLDAADVDVASADFTGENETVKSISFVTASEEIASSEKAKVKLRADNQYGKLASFNASSYNVSAINLSPTIRKDAEGYLIVTLNTKVDNTNSLIPGVSLIPVYVSYDNNRVTANKTFKLGTQPFATKLELSDPVYSNKGELLSQPGEVATVGLNIYDQYGNPITPEQQVEVNLNAFVTPYTDALNIDKTDTADDSYKVKVSINATNDATKKIEKAADYTLTVHAGGSSQTKTIKVGPSKLAMSVKVGDADLLAAGDTGVSKYVSLNVYDADGNALTNQEIVDNAARINITIGGATSDGKIVRTGKNKGKIKITDVPNTPNGYVFVTASIATINTSSYDSKSFKIEAPRVPDSIALTDVDATKAVLGAPSSFKLTVKDQYGDTITAPNSANANGKTYKVEVRLTNSKLGSNTLNTTVTGPATYAHSSAGAWTPVGTVDNLAAFNTTYTFNTFAADRGTARFEARLIATTTATTTDNTIATNYASLETIDPKTQLVYSLDALNTLYATQDAPAGYDLFVGSAIKPSINDALKRTISLTVKDGAGNKVAVPTNLIKYVSSSNPGVLSVDGIDVLGGKTGTASVTASVYGVDGVTRTLLVSGTVKNDAIVVKEIVPDTTDEVAITNNYALADLLDDAGLFVKDQYGNKYTGGTELLSNYSKVIGISFSITDIVSNDTNPAGAYIDFATNTIVYNNTAGFTLNVVSADGEVVASIAVTTA
ncbi:S-layer homology domain-containing protein [Cohnella cellulosilytica]|uniref:S-layer homology domain-containing protein n=2 Tax=Cohnella cellulosilytica TaxID=986710 RepID=A0ABW2FAV8_9BACL